ncbi:MAG: DUF2382 domain-containing protein, partial [Leptolyngbya sp. SIO4C1]|nr:DUF2382 domain-containing protein [Leptolyngbya sp. SIO4C1]
HAEQAVVHKQAVPREAVSIRKEAEHETVTAREPLQKETLTVQTTGEAEVLDKAGAAQFSPAQPAPPETSDLTREEAIEKIRRSRQG